MNIISIEIYDSCYPSYKDYKKLIRKRTQQVKTLLSRKLDEKDQISIDLVDFRISKSSYKLRKLS